VTQLDALKETRDSNNPSVTSFNYLLFSFGRLIVCSIANLFSNKYNFVNRTDPLRNVKVTVTVSILVQVSECVSKLHFIGFNLSSCFVCSVLRRELY
jgi:hypothetical protein